MEFLSRSLMLSDGRRLAYATLGPDGGLPVVYLHGGIGSRLEPSPQLLATVQQLGVQWVAVSRPGFGDSDRHPGHSTASVAADIAELAAARGWPRCVVVGVSSGAPYALACAAALPELVRGVALAAALSPRHALHRAPGISRLARAFLCAVVRWPRASSRVLGAIAVLLRTQEALVVRVAGCGRAPAVRAVLEATRGGVRGLIDDFVVTTRPWLPPPESIGVPVLVWHGGRDRLAPAEELAALAATFPRGELQVEPEESHFFFRRRCDEIAERLVHAAAAA